MNPFKTRRFYYFLASPTSPIDNEFMKSHMAFLILLVLTSTSCATVDGDEQPLTKAHPAAYAADNFTFGKPRKKSPANDFDFYYKNCNVVDRQAFPKGAIWQCSTP
jgi:hypothetical protein